MNLMKLSHGVRLIASGKIACSTRKLSDGQIWHFSTNLYEMCQSCFPIRNNYVCRENTKSHTRSEVKITLGTPRRIFGDKKKTLTWLRTLQHTFCRNEM